MNQVVDELINVVGKKYVVTNRAKTLRFRKGYRSGKGEALAVILPKNLMEMWQVLNILHDHHIIIIMQAANTSLTEGSIPAPGYDRPAAIVNGMRIKALQLINHGEQVLAFPGTTLFHLENALKPLKREPHSVIGSSNLGASVIGGINNNSGGALIRRGPAYTELSLYVWIDEHDEMHLVNHLGIDLGETPEEIITNLQTRNFDIDQVPNTKHHGSMFGHEQVVRDIESDKPIRYNANPKELFEVSGASGHVAALAVRLDTFPMDEQTQMFYIGTNDPDELEEIRRHIMTSFKHLPVSGEYMHKKAYELAKKYGKDSLIVIEKIGTGHLPQLFALKAWGERFLKHIPFFKPYFPDRLLQVLGHLFPNQLPDRLEEYARRYDHYLQLKMAGAGIQEARDYLPKYFAHATGDYFEANAVETSRAATHRYVTAGVAIRYQEIKQDTIDILPLDIALPSNAYHWFEHLPQEIEDQIAYKIYYGHFLDHVMHQDYILKPGVDAHKLKQAMLKILDQRHAIYPAEHNVGHLYLAAPALIKHYRQNDPTNSFNPGIGQQTMAKYWGEY
jgi:D-lactate dehydrogenase